MSDSNLRDDELFAQKSYIDGRWRSADEGGVFEVFNPATGDLIGHVPDCGLQETREAIAAAAIAFSVWRDKPAEERASVLERWYGLVSENIADLALIMTLEQGKPLKEAEAEVRYAASFIKWFAEEGRRIGERSVPAPQTDRRILLLKEPIGVSAAITPWNFPSAMITRKCAPALAAGCTVVVKPSELTPYSALALARLAERAGFPAGVFNVVTGRPDVIGAELTASQVVRKLSFTGSTAVGSLLMRQCATSVKRMSLELGGNAPFIVFEDADLDQAVEGAMASKFRNAGQTCVCANRILVQDSVYDEFAARLCSAVEALRVGDGRRHDTTIGPLINKKAVKKVRDHIADALSKGAVALTHRACNLDPERFVDPIVLGEAHSAMKLAQEETFGPVAPLFRFRDETEAIEIANDTTSGLASYFYTENLHRMWRMAERLETGVVAFNTGTISMEVSPFGGVKQSGLGREGGQSGIDEYMELKAFHIGGLKSTECK